MSIYDSDRKSPIPENQDLANALKTLPHPESGGSPTMNVHLQPPQFFLDRAKEDPCHPALYAFQVNRVKTHEGGRERKRWAFTGTVILDDRPTKADLDRLDELSQAVTAIAMSHTLTDFKSLQAREQQIERANRIIHEWKNRGQEGGA